jgi:hypothetical protein
VRAEAQMMSLRSNARLALRKGRSNQHRVEDMPSPRHFPGPWTVEDHLACFIVKDSTGQALAHIYYEDAGQQEAAKLLTKDEARRIAENFAWGLPKLD